MSVFYTMLLFISAIVFASKSENIFNSQYVIKSLSVMIIVLYIIAVSNPTIEGTDILNYWGNGIYYSQNGLWSSLKENFPEIGLIPLQVIAAKLNSIIILKFTAACLAILPLYYGVTKFFDKQTSLFILLFYFSCFFFTNGTINIIKQGVAVSFLLGGMLICLSKEKKQGLTMMLVAGLFHTTAFLFVLITILVMYNKLNFKVIIPVYIVSMLLFLTRWNATILRTIVSTNFISYESYVTDQRISKYGAANRIDFFIFTTFFVILAAVIYRLMKNNKMRSNFGYLFKIQLMFVSVFYCLGFIAYSDRIAYYNWMLIPLIIGALFQFAIAQRWIYGAGLIIFSISGFVLNMGLTGILREYPILFF
ncbi:EpsG family protein [Enterococcus faecium]|uniref:EpsG family protein n=1 Tax=Enterococcus faecium TaxID=1352 RepID=UPI00295E6DD9|nr:EpsG family protein [Enterococcus faecium]WOV56339.1 EpsG family protein [Enterococcus faecium]